MNFFKNAFKLGFLLVIPTYFFIFIIQLVFQTFEIAYPFFDRIHLPEWLYVPASALVAVLAAGGIGLILSWKWTDWLFSRIPLVKIPWNRLKIIADRLAFIMKGGYKMVMYSGWTNETRRERPGIVLGKVKREDADGKVRNLLVVMQPLPNVLDSLLIPVRDTEVVEGDIKDMVLYMSTGGIISPSVIKTRNWTSAEYKDVPDVSEDGNYKNGNGKAKKQD